MHGYHFMGEILWVSKRISAKHPKIPQRVMKKTAALFSAQYFGFIAGDYGLLFREPVYRADNRAIFLWHLQDI